MKTKLLLALTSLACLTAVQAQTVIQPVSATSSLGNLNNRPIEDAIDGTGLSGGGTSGDILSETHVNAGANDGPYFIGAKGSVLTFDLGTSYDNIDTVWIWNYTRTGADSRGIKDFDISFSSDGTDWGTGATTISAVNLTGDIAQVPYVDNSTVATVDSVSFTSQSGVRFIQLTNVDNYGDGSYTGFGEIRFGEAVPEPSSFALLSGMLALGWIMLRRRS